MAFGPFVLLVPLPQTRQQQMAQPVTIVDKKALAQGLLGFGRPAFFLHGQAQEILQFGIKRVHPCLIRGLLNHVVPPARLSHGFNTVDWILRRWRRGRVLP